MFSIVGAIFKPDDYQAEIAFRYAVSKFNSRNTNPFALAAYIDNIDVADSFTLASISKYIPFTHLCLLEFPTFINRTNPFRI